MSEHERGTPPPCEHALNRRELLKAGGLAAVAVAAGACGDASDVDVLTGELTLSLSENPGLDTIGSSVLVDAGLACPVAVTRTGPDTFLATSAECNHQGCCVRRSGEGWACPCHGSTFTLEGGLQRGPATADLIRYTTRLEGDALTIIGE